MKHICNKGNTLPRCDDIYCRRRNPPAQAVGNDACSREMCTQRKFVVSAGCVVADKAFGISRPFAETRDKRKMKPRGNNVPKTHA